MKKISARKILLVAWFLVCESSSVHTLGGICSFKKSKCEHRGLFIIGHSLTNSTEQHSAFIYTKKEVKYNTSIVKPSNMVLAALYSNHTDKKEIIISSYLQDTINKIRATRTE